MQLTLQKLDEIEFHDLPVESIQIITEPALSIAIAFLVFQEASSDYERYEMVFKGVSKFETEKWSVHSSGEIEIQRFEYQFENEFIARIIFLIGFGQPSCEMTVACKEIELRKVPNA